MRVFKNYLSRRLPNIRKFSNLNNSITEPLTLHYNLSDLEHEISSSQTHRTKLLTQLNERETNELEKSLYNSCTKLINHLEETDIEKSHAKEINNGEAKLEKQLALVEEKFAWYMQTERYKVVFMVAVGVGACLMFLDELGGGLDIIVGKRDSVIKPPKRK